MSKKCKHISTFSKVFSKEEIIVPSFCNPCSNKPIIDYELTSYLFKRTPECFFCKKKHLKTPHQRFQKSCLDNSIKEINNENYNIQKFTKIDKKTCNYNKCSIDNKKVYKKNICKECYHKYSKKMKDISLKVFDTSSTSKHKFCYHCKFPVYLKMFFHTECIKNIKYNNHSKKKKKTTRHKSKKKSKFKEN